MSWQCADCLVGVVGGHDRHCPRCLEVRRGSAETETVARIVAWLRVEALMPERYRDAEAWALAADAIERGDWRNGGGRDG